VHEVSLIDLMAVALLAGQLPQQRALIGIQPQTIAWGETPSPPISAAIRLACDQAMQLVGKWHA
jgi:hydrogenase maturation protease